MGQHLRACWVEQQFEVSPLAGSGDYVGLFGRSEVTLRNFAEIIGLPLRRES